MKLSSSLLIYTVSLVAMAGCAGYHVPPYGFAARDDKPVRATGQMIVMPVNAPSIPQGFNPNSWGESGLRTESGHEGIDIAAKTGTPVLAASDGTVMDSYYEPFYGNRVVINHGRGKDGMFIRSYYLHMNSRLVKKGQKVIQGRQIGELGSTGILASYPHLHFEIRISETPDSIHSVPLNPHIFWAGGAGIVTCFEKNKPWPKAEFRITYPVPCLNTPWE